MIDTHILDRCADKADSKTHDVGWVRNYAGLNGWGSRVI